MPSLPDAHLTLQERLRAIIVGLVTQAWHGLPGYDEEDVPQFVEQASAAVIAGQTRAVALADAYIARALGRGPLGLNAADLTGPAVRNGTPADVEWRRPFVQAWSALGRGVQYEDAIAQGLHRAANMAATDVQLAHLRAYNAIGAADERIVGYQRVPDGSACTFCRTIAGRRYHKQALQPVHAHCGCGVAPITEATRGDFFGKRENDIVREPYPEGVAVHEHGELGPVLAAPGDHFTSLSDFT